ncbi:MAG TPA: outer membrane beta-barrel protein [Bacteroidia bacterium]|nr:outer membrane beta-barrel protein [Bacteroidia bacterium]
MFHPRILIFFLFLATVSYSVAQQKTDYKGESEFDLKNYKGDPRDRLILEVNYTNWLGAPKNIKSDWKCVGFNFASMFDKPFGTSNFSLGFGLGIYVHNFSSNADFILKLDSNNQNATTVLQPRTTPYIANRYNERSFEIPVELRFRTKSATMFKVMLGGKIGYVISDFKKTDDADGRVRRYNMPNINRLRYGVNFRIGIEQICLTGCYYLSEVFTDNGPRGVHPFSIGIAIIPY